MIGQRTILNRDNDIKQRFRLFLQSHDAWSLYKDHFKEHSIKKNLPLLEQWLDNNPNYTKLIIKAFVWSSTPEGLEYWENLDQKWQDICSDYYLYENQ